MHRLAAQNSLLEGTFRQIYNGSGKNVTDLGPPLNDLARSVLPWNVARSYGCFDGGAGSDTTIVQSIKDPPLSTLMTSGSFSKTRVGYAVGAGGEWMLSSNWSAKLEYLYYDLGSVTCATGGLASDIGAVLNPATSTGVAAVATSSQVRFKDSIVRVGVNHHFGSPAVSQY